MVATQTLNTYDDAGNLISTASYDRLNDESDATTGALTTSNARVSYVAIYPDAIGRTQATVNYGALSSFTRSSTIPTRDDTRLITSHTYLDNGRLNVTTDPSGISQSQDFDDAGRRTQLIEAIGTGDERETDWTYTLDNQVATQTAINSATNDQTTTYTYGSTLTASDIARNDLLVRVAYPDSTGTSDTVTTTYNRQGQKKTVTDQRGVVHTYVYDALGRLTDDNVTSLGGSGIVNGDVRRIQTIYDTRGRVTNVRSHDTHTSGGSIVNDVQMEYNGFNQLTKEYQEHSGAVNTSTTPKVQYGYEPGNASTTQTNNIRPTTLTYPNGRVITYQYGATDSLTDLLNRAEEIYDTTNAQSLAQYKYLGSGLAVRVIYPEPEVMLDLWGLSETTGQFDGLDRFNRVTDQKWRKYGGTTTTLDQYTYDYDRNSNRLTRGNGTHNDFNEAYTYDHLNRLTNMERGDSSINFTEEWELDTTGNWMSYVTTDGSTSTLSQTRTANQANEITDITSTPTWADPSYDAAGNMTAFVKPGSPSSNLTAVYDAWDRLVQVKDGSLALSGRAFDGVSRTAVMLTYTGGTLAETRHLFFSEAWQTLEERLGSATSAASQTVFGRTYIDEVNCRDDGGGRTYASLDANWNLTSGVTSGATVSERYAYSSYGRQSVFDASWSSRSTPVLTLGCGFQSLQTLTDTGLVKARHRETCAYTGTWSRRDPLRYVDGSNLYQFERSNPVRFTDPMGQDAGGRLPNSPTIVWGRSCGVLFPPAVRDTIIPTIRDLNLYCGGGCGGVVTINCDGGCGEFHTDGCTITVGPACNNNVPSPSLNPPFTFLIHELRHVMQNCQYGDFADVSCMSELWREIDAYLYANQCSVSFPASAPGSCCERACSSMETGTRCFDSWPRFDQFKNCMIMCSLVWAPGRFPPLIPGAQCWGPNITTGY